MSTWGTGGSSHPEPDLHPSKVPARLILAVLGNKCRLRSQSWSGTVSRWVWLSNEWMNEWLTEWMNVLWGLITAPLFGSRSCGLFFRLEELVCASDKLDSAGFSFLLSVLCMFLLQKSAALSSLVKFQPSVWTPASLQTCRRVTCTMLMHGSHGWMIQTDVAFLLAAVSLGRFSVALTLQLKCFQSPYVTETRPGAQTGWPAALRLILPWTFTFIG